MTRDEAWKVKEALYDALKRYRGGEFRDRQIGAGILPPDLSAVLIETEREIEILTNE